MATKNISYRAGSQWARMSWSSRLGAITAVLALLAILWVYWKLQTAPAAPSKAEPAYAAAAPSKPQRTPEQLKADREINTVLAGARMLKEAMKKPESFELVNATMIDGKVICYEYRARNSFNDRRTERYVVSDSVSSNKLKDWNKLCAGKNGTDYTSVRAVM